MVDKIAGSNFERRREAQAAPKGWRAGCPESSGGEAACLEMIQINEPV